MKKSYKQGKRITAVILAFAVFLSYLPFSSEAEAYTINTVTVNGKYLVDELTEDAVTALNDLSMTDKEMLDDIVERSYHNDFQNKTYIIKTKGEELNKTYWSQYVTSKGDFNITIYYSEDPYLATADGEYYHVIHMTSKNTFSPFDYDTRTIERWDEYNDKITQVEKEIGILDDSLCDYQKIQLAYIWIKQNIVDGTLGYTSVSAGQEAVEAVLDGHAACAGFSRVFNRFMHDAGVESYWTSVNYMSHAKNIVKLGNLWYGADCQMGILTCYEGYEEYNNSGKLLWDTSSGLFALFDENTDYLLTKTYEGEAILYYDSSVKNACFPYMFDRNKIATYCPLAEITLPTCTTDGTFLKEGKVDEHCDYCGKVHSFTLPASHSYETVEVKPSTCTETGYVKKKCSVCGETVTETIPKKEHNYKIGARYATCVDEGVFQITCSECGDIYYAEYTEKSEHTLSEWKTLRTYSGWEYRYCTSGDEDITNRYAEYRNVYTGEISTVKPTANAEGETTTKEPVTETTIPNETTNYIEPTTKTTEPTENSTDVTEPVETEGTTALIETTTQEVHTTVKQDATTTTATETTATGKVKKPAKAVITKAVNKKGKKIKVKWKKVVNATKYQVKAVYKKKMVVYDVSGTKVSCKIKRLKKGKKYKVYVRAGNSAGWGKWSRVKKVKVKK